MSFVTDWGGVTVRDGFFVSDDAPVLQLIAAGPDTTNYVVEDDGTLVTQDDGTQVTTG